MTSIVVSVTIKCKISKPFKEKQYINKTTRLNEAIRAPELRVIDADGQSLGVMPRASALSAAETAGLDLVEISPEARPPVVKIVDWGKYNYQRTKQLQKNKRNAKALEVKQMRFGLKISDHDLGVKLRKITDFLTEGHKVKIAIVYRGRENAHRDIGFKLADRVIESFNGTIAVDQQPQLNGKQLIFVIRSNPSAKLSKESPLAETRAYK